MPRTTTPPMTMPDGASRFSGSTGLHANLITTFLDSLFGPSKSSKGGLNITETHEVVVIGAGVAGLVAAKTLAAEGKDVVVVEAANQVGGRVQTDEYKGFLLDRGFQVFIEAYPAVKRQLDYQALDLQSFWPGALVRADGGFHTVADPFRRPQDLIKGLLAPVGSLGDKFKVGLLRVQATLTPLRAIFDSAETDTLTHLSKTKGLSPAIIERFFTPFYQGIYLAPLAEQSSRMFDFVFRMFAEGGISLPARGIRAVPEQLAATLPKGSLQLGVAALRVGRGFVELSDGRVLGAEAVVVATEEETARKLLKKELVRERPKPLGGRGSTCLYYAVPGPAPIREPLLVLNGESAALGGRPGTTSGGAGGGTAGVAKTAGIRTGRASARGAKKADTASPSPSPSSSRPASRYPVNNVVFLSNIAPTYAPPGQTLVSVTVVGTPAVTDAVLDKAVKEQLGDWFGREAVLGQWELLRIYRIPYAQPRQVPPTGPSFVLPAAVDWAQAGEGGEGLFVAGDYRNTATLNGACESGERAAKAVLAHLAAHPPGEERRQGIEGGTLRKETWEEGDGRGGKRIPDAEAQPSLAASSSSTSTSALPSRPSMPRRSHRGQDATEAFARFRQENERGRSTIQGVVSGMEGRRGSPIVSRFREVSEARQSPVVAEKDMARARAAALRVVAPQPASSVVDEGFNLSRFRSDPDERKRIIMDKAAFTAPKEGMRQMTSSSALTPSPAASTSATLRSSGVRSDASSGRESRFRD
ncbi:hypothetical protein NSK_002864 [Nannochloropsis salina CCMP1776]|uniref:Amine oxidase n=1 Tax=Nannochloropsis salina CCMP1776 TaxID=1027361 RepID=A0A4D9D4V7_9STRA|nr:hypothetical protein NSK_002864 [Nannochloropsis salina CCMP1776]|eukprot:TFJ86044.1 hypothetical protein NSK_002864 [Nannochloropsis salina CCMP1776]